MLKKSTSSSTLDNNRMLASEKKDECLKPCESTLAIIRQFARATISSVRLLQGMPQLYSTESSVLSAQRVISRFDQSL